MQIAKNLGAHKGALIFCQPNMCFAQLSPTIVGSKCSQVYKDFTS